MKQTKATKRMKSIAISILTGAAMLLLSACGNSARQESIEAISQKYAVPEEKQLIVYTSHKEEVYQPIIREFENRTGIWVELHTGGTAEMMAQVKEASQEGRCDIMFGGGIESYEAEKEMFMPYEPQEKAALDPNYVDDENYWTPFTELPLVFVYNKKLVSGSEIPRTWTDLMGDRWRGQIAFADLNNSGTSYTILYTMEGTVGAKMEVLIERIYKRLEGRVLESSGEIIPKVADGSFLVGITLEETAKKAMEENTDIGMIYPDVTSAVPDGVAMVKNAPHSYNAGKFIDFVVSYDTQKYCVDNFYRRSVRKDLAHNDGNSLDLIRFNVERAAKRQELAFEIWNSLIGKEDG